MGSLSFASEIVFLTNFARLSFSVSNLKDTMNEAILSFDIEIISSKSLSAINSLSIGSTINFSISFADIPSYLIITATVLRSISGISSLGKVRYEITPKRIIISKSVEIVFFLKRIADKILRSILCLNSLFAWQSKK